MPPPGFEPGSKPPQGLMLSRLHHGDLRCIGNKTFINHSTPRLLWLKNRKIKKTFMFLWVLGRLSLSVLVVERQILLEVPKHERTLWLILVLAAVFGGQINGRCYNYLEDYAGEPRS